MADQAIVVIGEHHDKWLNSRTEKIEQV